MIRNQILGLMESRHGFPEGMGLNNQCNHHDGMKSSHDLPGHAGSTFRGINFRQVLGRDAQLAHARASKKQNFNHCS